MSHLRARNPIVRKFGCGPVEALTRSQLAERFNYLRARGRTWEAIDLLQRWLAAEKFTQRSGV